MASFTQTAARLIRCTVLETQAHLVSRGRAAPCFASMSAGVRDQKSEVRSHISDSITRSPPQQKTMPLRVRCLPEGDPTPAGSAATVRAFVCRRTRIPPRRVVAQHRPQRHQQLSRQRHDRDLLARRDLRRGKSQIAGGVKSSTPGGTSNCLGCSELKRPEHAYVVFADVALSVVAEIHVPALHV